MVFMAQESWVMKAALEERRFNLIMYLKGRGSTSRAIIHNLFFSPLLALWLCFHCFVRNVEVLVGML